tara:strand:+ start:216 stop:1742 length:1527 start_codon:yes stop_codon:yes gene_type:complete
VIHSLLFQHAEATPERPFLIFEGRTITYGEMGMLVSAFADVLESKGVRVGDHVAMLCSNRPAYLVAWFTLMEIGAVTVPLNVGLVADGLRYTIEQSDARFVLIEPVLLEAKSVHLDNLASSPEIILIDGAVEAVNGEEVKRRDQSLEELKEATLNSILYTSGTTGLPKGVMIPNGAYMAAGKDMSAALAMSADDRILVFLPLFHANPQMYAVASAVTVGASIILLPAFNAKEFFDVVRRTQATGFTYVGTVLSLLDKRNPGPRSDHMLRWCVGGGAPAEIWEAIESRFGLAVHELYGMTETGGWVTMNVAGDSRRGTVGHPRSGIAIEIRAADGRVLAAGEKGEIVARSDRPHILFPGYWKNPEATAETLVDGWLHTGDRGHLDSDRFLVFDGRVKELIRRGGEMISPVEIEQQLLRHPSVRECAVVPEPDDVMDEEIRAVIVANGSVAAQELNIFLRDSLPRYMMPRYYSFVEQLPKTETEKIQRNRVTPMNDDTVDLRLQAKGIPL